MENNNQDFYYYKENGYITKFHKNDVLTLAQGKAVNLERFNLFIDNVKKGKSDSIRTIIFDIEGNPTINYIYYNGKFFYIRSYVRDDRTSTIKVDEYIGTDIVENQKRRYIEYYLMGTGEEINPQIYYYDITI